MPENPRSEYLAECFWPGVRDADLQKLDDRVQAVVTDLAQSDEQIRYLGSLLMRTDEVILCLFEGPEQTVREAAKRAQLPFERILQVTRSTGVPEPKGDRP
jgi:hypothetical protein